ncbi:MAG TPA: vitamin K epoxide reductase family protein, partial [Pirellulaceae bacterium]
MSTSLSTPQDDTELNSRRPAPSRVALWCMIFAAMVAFGFSSFLAWSTLQVGDIVGCAPEGKWDCSHVTKTKWSALFGIPVSLPGAATYGVVLVVLVALALSSQVRQWRWPRNALVTASVTAVLCGIYFTALQYVVIEKWCKWCLVVHAMGLTLFLLLCASRIVSLGQFARWGSLGLAAVLGLMVTQYYSEPPKTYSVQRFAVPAFEGEEATLEDIADLDADFGEAPDLDVLDIVESPQDPGANALSPTDPISATLPSDEEAVTLISSGP